MKHILMIATVIILLTVTANAQDTVLHSAKFIGEKQFVVVDGDGLHVYPFLLADIVFVGDSLPRDGDTLTIGSTTFTFRDSASLPEDIQIKGEVDSQVDTVRDKLNDAHIVLRTSRTGTTIILVVAETVAPTLSTTANPHAITVTSFNSCGAP